MEDCYTQGTLDQIVALTEAQKHWLAASGAELNMVGDNRSAIEKLANLEPLQHYHVYWGDYHRKEVKAEEISFLYVAAPDHIRASPMLSELVDLCRNNNFVGVLNKILLNKGNQELDSIRAAFGRNCSKYRFDSFGGYVYVVTRTHWACRTTAADFQINEDGSIDIGKDYSGKFEDVEEKVGV